MPTITTDVQITTSSSGNLTDSGYNLYLESLNVTDSSPRTGYTIINNSTATPSTIQLGAGANFTNYYSGKTNDLLFLQDTNLTITGLVSGKSALGLVLTQSGNFDLAVGSSPVASTLTISAVISGAYGIAVTGDGTGTTVLSGANIYSGGTTLSSGAMALGASSVVSGGVVTSGPVGTGTLTLGGGTLRADGTTARTISNNLSLSGSIVLGDATNTGSLLFDNTGLTTKSAVLTANTSLTNASTVEFVSVLSGNASLNKAGAGTLFLDSANTYGGGTSISGGVVAISTNSATSGGLLVSGALGTGTLTLGDGTRIRTGDATGRVIENNVSLSGNVSFGSTGTGFGPLTFSSTGLTTSSTITLTANTTVTVLSDTVVTFNNSMSGGSFGLTKAGAATLVLANANTYAGGTQVTAGTLLTTNTSGSATGAGTVSVSSGATLGGTGFITGNTTVASGGTLAPGATGGTSIGKLTLGTASTGTTAINGIYAVNLTGSATPAAGTTYDQISVLGALTLNPTSSSLTVTTASPTVLAAGQVFYIALNDGTDAVTGTFSQGAAVTDNLGDTFAISYLANGDNGTLGNDISLTVLTVVPEPATLLGGTLLLGALGWNQRRRMRRLFFGRWSQVAA